jgi:hypothetical protein
MIATQGASSDTSADGGPDDGGGTDDGAATSADSTGDGGSTGTGEFPPPDLTDGQWVFENVSNSNPMSLHPTRVVLDSGTEVVAWAETELSDIGVLNIFGAVGGDGVWSSVPLTAFDVQNTFPSLAGGPIAHLAWTGRTDAADDLDVFFATGSDGGWTAPRNLTDSFDGLDGVNETRPAIGHRSSGELFIAYIAGPPPPPMGAAETPGVFMIELTADNNPSGQKEVITPLTAHCSGLVAAAAGDDTGHVVASCTQDGAGVLIHVTDRSGTWNDDTLAGTTSGVLSPDLVAGGDGAVHLAWIQNTPCGADQCSDVYYAGTTENVFGTPVNVTDSANLDERQPTVGVDAWGRVLVLSQVRTDGVAGLYLAISEDGEVFTPSTRISPPGAVDDYQTPRALAFSAEGYPSFAYERVVDGSDPLNIDIEIARFVPN